MHAITEYHQPTENHVSVKRDGPGCGVTCSTATLPIIHLTGHVSAQSTITALQIVLTEFVDRRDQM